MLQSLWLTYHDGSNGMKDGVNPFSKTTWWPYTRALDIKEKSYYDSFSVDFGPFWCRNSFVGSESCSKSFSNPFCVGSLLMLPITVKPFCLGTIEAPLLTISTAVSKRQQQQSINAIWCFLLPLFLDHSSEIGKIWGLCYTMSKTEQNRNYPHRMIIS